MNNKKIPSVIQRIDNYEINKTINNKSSEVSYVLKNMNDDIYIVLGSYDYFIWNCMDGKNKIEDINLKFFKEFNKIGIEYIENFIINIGEKGFVKYFNYDKKKLKYKQKVTEIRIPIKNINRFFELLYRLIGKILLNNISICIYILISLIGLALYFFSTPSNIYIERNTSNLLLLYISVLGSTLLHEVSHAMVCLHYKRKVNDAGVMLYMFLPVFYVNTSDIWMEQRKARVFVSLAGPFCDVFIGSLSLILYYILGEQPISAIFYQVTLLAFARVILNLNPLLKWDGYYCLMDIMGIYNLREKSRVFITKKMPRKIKNREKFNYMDLCLLLYGIISLIYVTYFLGKLFLNNINFWLHFNSANLNLNVFLNLIIIFPFIFMGLKLIFNGIARILPFKILKR